MNLIMRLLAGPDAISNCTAFDAAIGFQRHLRAPNFRNWLGRMGGAHIPMMPMPGANYGNRAKPDLSTGALGISGAERGAAAPLLPDRCRLSESQHLLQRPAAGIGVAN